VTVRHQINRQISLAKHSFPAKRLLSALT